MVSLNNLLLIQFAIILILLNQCSSKYMSSSRPMKNTSPFFTVRGPDILGIPIPIGGIIIGGSDYQFDKQTTSDELSFLVKYPLQYSLNPFVRASIGTLNTIEMIGDQTPFRPIFSPIFRALSQPASFNFKRPIEH